MDKFKLLLALAITDLFLRLAVADSADDDFCNYNQSVFELGHGGKLGDCCRVDVQCLSGCCDELMCKVDTHCMEDLGAEEEAVGSGSVPSQALLLVICGALICAPGLGTFAYYRYLVWKYGRSVDPEEAQRTSRMERAERELQIQTHALMLRALRGHPRRMPPSSTITQGPSF